MAQLSHWLSMEKEHVLAWLTCHAKLLHCLGHRLFFTVTHEYHFCFLQIQHAREMREILTYWSTWRDFWRITVLSIVKSFTSSGNWAFPLKVSWTALYKVSLYKEVPCFKKRGMDNFTTVKNQNPVLVLCFFLLSWYVNYIDWEWRQGSLSPAITIFPSFV